MSIANQSVLLDTNLFLLISVGEFDSSLIGRKRLDTFDVEDLTRLKRLIAHFPHNLTTPHVLAESSNLADQCVPKSRHREFRKFFKNFIANFEEAWNAAEQICGSEAFLRLGLTDAAIARLAEDNTLVLSVDLELCSVLHGR